MSLKRFMKTLFGGRSTDTDRGEQQALFAAAIDLGGNLVAQAMARVAVARTAAS